MILREEGKAEKSCEEMRQDQQRVLRGSERSVCVCVSVFRGGGWLELQ